MVVLTVASVPAKARELALLIGVSGYENRSYVAPLDGPRNDVTIMWRLLKKQRFSDDDIVVLADGIPATPDYPKVQARPTYTAIRAAFDDTAKHATKGDFVYIHISSHGSQQPVQVGIGEQQQPWAQNQVMLPIDVRRSTDGKTMPAGLPVVVIDMCQAGDSIRGEFANGHRRVDALGPWLFHPRRCL